MGTTFYERSEGKFGRYGDLEASYELVPALLEKFLSHLHHLLGLGVAGENFLPIYSDLSDWNGKKDLQKLQLFDIQFPANTRPMELLRSALPSLQALDINESPDASTPMYAISTTAEEAAQLQLAHTTLGEKTGCDKLQTLVLSRITWGAELARSELGSLGNLVSLTLEIPCEYLGWMSEVLQAMQKAPSEFKLILIGVFVMRNYIDACFNDTSFCRC